MPNQIRIKRPIKFKLDAYRLFYTVQVDTAQEAFAKAAELNDTTLSGCMTDYASSYMSDDVKNFLRKKLNAGNVEVHTYFDTHQMTKDF